MLLSFRVRLLSVCPRDLGDSCAGTHHPSFGLVGKLRRLTFIECNNDLNSMIDIGKVADLVLLMIDASIGFEMVREGRWSSSWTSGIHSTNVGP